MKKGASYIRFTKYGSVIKGTVMDIGETIVVDLNNGVYYKVSYIITDKGIHLNLDGSDGKIFEVTKTLTEEEIENFRNIKFKK